MAAKGFELPIDSTVDPKEVGAALRRLRQQVGIPAGELAADMDWKAQNVTRLERGDSAREPMMSTVNLYLRRLGFELVLVARPLGTGRKQQPKKAAAPGGDDDS